jgi:putative GTP pyrophosphokinase
MNIEKRQNLAERSDFKDDAELQHVLLDHAEEFIELEILYDSGIREIMTKLEILDNEFKVRFKRNPIHHMECRLKNPLSILQKLRRRGFDLSVSSAKENLTDLAGVRVICNYIDDIYVISDLLCAQDDVSLVKITDYIKNPKPNGYRSLHIVVNVPVYLNEGKKYVPVEIQIRTIAMDFWASLEHQIHYKGVECIPDELTQRLKECAENIASIDVEMQNIDIELKEIIKASNKA